MVEEENNSTQKIKEVLGKIRDFIYIYILKKREIILNFVVKISLA